MWNCRCLDAWYDTSGLRIDDLLRWVNVLLDGELLSLSLLLGRLPSSVTSTTPEPVKIARAGNGCATCITFVDIPYTVAYNPYGPFNFDIRGNMFVIDDDPIFFFIVVVEDDVDGEMLFVGFEIVEI